MATVESLTADIDRVIAYFNARKMDLPDDFFDRKTQFVINGAPFETLLGQSPSDPLVLMLSRGPAGFRFTAKALQHAIPDARLERPSTPVAPSSTDPLSLRTELRLTGQLRGTNEAVTAVIPITLKLNDTGQVEVAEARMDADTLEKIREARRRS